MKKIKQTIPLILFGIILSFITLSLFKNKPAQKLSSLQESDYPLGEQEQYGYFLQQKIYNTLKFIDTGNFALLELANNHLDSTQNKNDTLLARVITKILDSLDKIGNHYSYAFIGKYIAIYKPHKNIVTPADHIIRDTALIREIRKTFERMEAK